MRYITLVLVACLSITACGQSKSQKEEKEQIALVEKYTEKIWSEMKHYEVQPAYYLRLYHTNCTFQVLVNGIKAYDGDSLEKLGSAVFINRFILKSGKQEVTVRMYPLGTLLQEEYGEENYDDILTLLPQSNVEVKVTHIADLKTYESPSKDEKTLLIHNSPVDNQKEFIGKGLPYYEYSFEFDAKVPYEFEGWSNGVDLSTVNQEELKEKFIVLNTNLRQIL